MSYGNPPDKCSNKDFTEYWRKEGFTCIKSDDMAGGAKLDQCVTRCTKQTCAPDVSTKVGCNQMFNCPQACKMRNLGLSRDTCLVKCKPNGGSGCSPTFNSWEFMLCDGCNRAGCSEWPTVQECEVGCDLYGMV